MKTLLRAVRVLLGLLLKRPIIGVCIIPILPDGRVVLMQRRDSGLWGLPGGIIDWGEDISACVVRELQEETGLSVTQMGRLIGVYSAPERDPRFHSICVAVEVFAAGPLQTHDTTEVLTVNAFTWNELSQLPLAHDHAHHIEDYLANRTVVA